MWAVVLLLCCLPPCSLSSPSSPSSVIRLTGERRKPHEGRVEVQVNGQWGTVCDDDFSLSAARVVCRQLGFTDADNWSPRAKYGQGSGHIWLDNVHCSGLEKSLLDCPSNGVGVTDCKHSEDVGVACVQKRIAGFSFLQTPSEQQQKVQVQDVRLRATYSQRQRVPITEGFLEVKDSGKWRQICDVNWSPRNSRVICGMYGFPSDKRYNAKPYKLLASRRKKNFWSHSVKCSGNEASLSECVLGPDIPLRGNLTCSEGTPVVVSCAPGPAFAPSGNRSYRKAYRLEQPLVRLRGGAKLGQGRVEVLKNGQWGSVCDDLWDLTAASVVCRELGFGSAKEAHGGARMGQGLGPVHMSQVRCSGFEKSLTDCHFLSETTDCSHEEDAAVSCYVPHMDYGKRLRLAGGRNPFEGRVEVLEKRNGSLVWGSVCSEGWGTLEAVVVCRQLGLGYASHAFQETWYWPAQGTDAVLLSGVKCSGTELTLDQCFHHGTNIQCPRGGGRYSAGVSCTHMAPDLVLSPAVVEQTSYLEDRPLYALTCALEEKCLSSSAHSADPHSNRRLLRFSSRIHNTGQSDFRPRSGPQEWVWHECHRHYHSMEVFTHYDLLSLNGTKMAEGHKASFCLEDTHCDEGIEKRYECANFGQQGVSVGCWDTYRHDIDCQWIDITDLSPGDYILQVVINPYFEVAESDFSNNVMKCNTRYDGHRVWTYNCHTSGSLSSDTDDLFPGLLTNRITHR
ncbi:unnamed protein product [Knipowitschia caucasica]